MDILRIKWIDGTLGKREVINSVQQVGFSASIFAQKAIDLMLKREIDLRMVLEIIKPQFLKEHGRDL